MFSDKLLSNCLILWILFEFLARDLNAPAAENLKVSCTIVIEDNWRWAVWNYKYTFFRFNLFIHPRILVSIYKYTEVTLTSVSVIILHWCHIRVQEHSRLKAKKVQLKEAALFASKADIKHFFKFFLSDTQLQIDSKNVKLIFPKHNGLYALSILPKCFLGIPDQN